MNIKMIYKTVLLLEDNKSKCRALDYDQAMKYLLAKASSETKKAK